MESRNQVAGNRWEEYGRRGDGLGGVDMSFLWLKDAKLANSLKPGIRGDLLLSPRDENSE